MAWGGSMAADPTIVSDPPETTRGTIWSCSRAHTRAAERSDRFRIALGRFPSVDIQARQYHHVPARPAAYNCVSTVRAVGSASNRCRGPRGSRSSPRRTKWFLARWAKRLSWTDVACAFHTSWDSVFRAVAMAVAWGRAQLDLTGIEAIGVDEIHGSNQLTFCLGLAKVVESLPTAAGCSSRLGRPAGADARANPYAQRKKVQSGCHSEGRRAEPLDLPDPAFQ
jgi:hypothetical protein